MYDLGEQFNMDLEKAKANPKCVFRGAKYRITVLTDRLIRLEYQKDGQFVDQPSELAWYRNFEKPYFLVKEDSRYLEIKSKYFKLSYVKNQPFQGSKINTMANLKVELLNTDRIWYYGHPEVRNYGSPGFSLDDTKGKVPLSKGLYSSDGFATIDDSQSRIFNALGNLEDRPEGSVDIYLFMYLKDFAACLKDYFMLTGYPALIPRYALGNWWSRNVPYHDLELKNLIAEFEREEIPLSVLALNEDWHLRTSGKKENLKTGYTWNKELFKSPKDMIRYLHSKGIRLGLNINPLEGIYPMEGNYQQFIKYVTPNSDGVVPFNTVDPKWMDAYLKILVHPLDAIGVDFFWLDIEKVEDRYKLWYLDHYHYLDMKRDYSRRPMVLARNAGIAPHRYPVLYSGKTIVSWDTLKEIPFFNTSASNIGVTWWAHDIGGYYKGIEDEELYIRFLELAVFSPIVKFGTEKGKYYKREPWKWNVKTLEIAKDYLQLRHRMIPYLYAEAYKYYKYGMPLVQPIYYKFPELYDDPKYRNEYYFGTEMFVAPIIAKNEPLMNRVIHYFYLPDGIWYDIVTGKKFPGGRKYVSFFRDQDYPVFASAGAIIPMGSHEIINDTTPPQDMEIQIFPGKSNTYKMYEDDGVSDLYRKGFYLLTSIDYNYLPNNYTVIIRALEGKSGIVPDTRNYKIRFRNTKKANDVVVYFNDGKIEGKSYVDGPDFIVEVNNVPTIGQLTINCKGKDIEIDAVRLINEDIASIINDLQIETTLKEKIDEILFGNLEIKKKRIEITKLGRKGLERKYVRLFKKLLEYVEQV